jgi:leucyl-tRNA synthetase
MPSEAQQQAGIVAPQVKVEQLNDALFDYIFFEVPYDDTKISVPQALCDKMRAEFEFWYPHDLRVSGKDLLQNHLVMSLYNHAAVWGGRTDRMPAGYYANGLLMIDGNKMSKSTGNFLTLAQAIDQYGADAVRFALASSGDSLEDANFSTKTAEGAILKFTLAQDVFDTHYFPFIKKGLYRTGDFTFWDCVALQRMSTALERMKQAYENMQMLEVIRQYHVLFQIRDEYRIAITPEGAVVTRADYVDTNFHEAVIITFMRAVSVAISPVVPHWCQSLHEQLIESGFLAKVQGVTMLSSTIPPLVIDEAWPVITVPSCGVDNIIAKAQYLLIQSDIIRTQFANYQRLHEKKAKKGPDGTIPALNHVLIRLATGYTEWQNKVISTCLEHSKQFGDHAFTDEINTLKTTVAAQFDDKKIKTNAMKFTMDLISDYKSIESGTEAEKVAQSFNTQLPFDEVGLWSQFTPFLIRAMAPILASAPETFTISPIDPANPLDEQGKPLQQPPRPLKPIFIYSNKQ